MRQGSTDLPPWPCSRRRTALEELFAETRMTAPLTLCPSTADPDTARQWLTWTSTGQEGLVFKPLRAHTGRAPEPGASTRSASPRTAVVGAVTGPATAAVVRGRVGSGWCTGAGQRCHSSRAAPRPRIAFSGAPITGLAALVP